MEIATAPFDQLFCVVTGVLELGCRMAEQIVNITPQLPTQQPYSGSLDLSPWEHLHHENAWKLQRSGPLHPSVSWLLNIFQDAITRHPVWPGTESWMLKRMRTGHPMHLRWRLIDTASTEDLSSNIISCPTVPSGLASPAQHWDARNELLTDLLAKQLSSFFKFRRKAVRKRGREERAWKPKDLPEGAGKSSVVLVGDRIPNMMALEYFLRVMFWNL